MITHTQTQTRTHKTIKPGQCLPSTSGCISANESDIKMLIVKQSGLYFEHFNCRATPGGGLSLTYDVVCVADFFQAVQGAFKTRKLLNFVCRSLTVSGLSTDVVLLLMTQKMLIVV